MTMNLLINYRKVFNDRNKCELRESISFYNFINKIIERGSRIPK